MYFILVLVLTAGCVLLPGRGKPSETAVSSRGDIQGLDAGAKNFESQHFRVYAYHLNEVKDIADLAERLYERLLNDTGLNSYVPKGRYELVVYAHQREYLSKTGMPLWSGGTVSGGTLYTYEGPQLPAVLAHDMAHLLLREYWAREQTELRWIDEGLAVYEEQEATGSRNELGRVLGAAYTADWSTAGGRPIPFDQMIALAPASDEQQAMGVWYLQVGSLVRFMIERGGRAGFSQFLRSLHDGRSVDEAIRLGFPGLWDGLRSLELAWLAR